MKKAVIIGSGVAGLACSVRLALKGYSVTVLESNSYPGGKLAEFSLNGFRFDAGPSLFTMPELVDELFTLAGKDPKTNFKYKKLNHICTYFYSDGTILQAQSDLDLFLKQASIATHVDSARLNKHLNKSEFIYKHTAHLFLEKSLHKFSSYCNLKTLRSVFMLPFLGIFTTMNRMNQKALGNDKMTQFFNRYATYNGSDPYRAPGILNIIPHLEFSKGAYFPEKGMYQITDSIYHLAISLGVKFYFETPADKIEIESKKVVSVKSKDKKWEADLVVCNMDVVPAYKKLLADRKQPHKILKQERSSSALIFYWGVKADFKELNLHNIFFSNNYKKEFETIFKGQSIDEDPTVYINITSKLNPSDAPQGMENWFVMINVPSNKGQDWDTLIKKARKNIIAKLSGILKRDISELIIAEEILDPRSIELKTGSFQGSLYGTSSNSRMAAFFRHPNFTRKIKNLYFCGGSVHPGGGIPLALSSAKIVDSIIPKAS